jgi:hypothetical protein
MFRHALYFSTTINLIVELRFQGATSFQVPEGRSIYHTSVKNSARKQHMRKLIRHFKGPSTRSFGTIICSLMYWFN